MAKPSSTDTTNGARAAQGTAAEAAVDMEQSAAELEAVREWLRQGGHNDPEILTIAARRLIESGWLAMNWGMDE